MFKLFEINSIRLRMVSGFLFLTFLILVLSSVSLSIIDQTTHIAHVNGDISQLQVYTLSLIKSDNDFFDLETINDHYFKTHQSDFLEHHDSLYFLITSRINRIIAREKDKNRDIEQNLIGIDSTLFLYHVRFRKLEELVFKKGFRDYGVEGAMRYHAHKVEEDISDADMLSLLFLRRHEKDFLLRNDTAYLRAYKKRSASLLLSLLQDEARHQVSIRHLKEYELLFNELANIQLELGLTSKHGLRNELNNLTYLLSNQYYQLSEFSNSHSETAYNNLRLFYIILLTGAILFSLLTGYWISKRLSEPIARLSSIIQGSLTDRNVTKTDLRIPNAANEIKTLADSFVLLMNRAEVQMEKAKTRSSLLKKKNKELKKLNHELDNFLYSTAHDLRAPLSSLLGLINILRYENKQQNIVPHIDMMEKSIHRSENFIAQIVSFSKNKQMDIVPEMIDLRELILNIFEDHQFIENAPKIEKSIIINERIPFYSDRNRVMIIFNNLISNAIKYSDLEKRNSFIKIDIEMSTRETTITFEDNGLGISEQHIHNIFDMFYRAHINSKGSGLGLFIFKETITRMDGRVEVQSFEGAGTRFFISLPNLTPQNIEGIRKINEIMEI